MIRRYPEGAPRLRAIGLLLLALFLPRPPLPALAASAAEEFLRLAGKLASIQSPQDAESLLGPPEETHPVGGAPDLLRHSWLHGEMGIEIYFLKGTARRIDLSRRFDRNIDLLRTLDELTRRGQRQYGSMPRFDTGKNEYYWTAQGRRLAFSRDEPGAIRVRCTAE